MGRSRGRKPSNRSANMGLAVLAVVVAGLMGFSLMRDPAPTTSAARAPQAPAASAQVPRSEARPRMITFGHSYVRGVGASSPGKSWANVTAASDCRQLVGKGVNGALAADTAEVVLKFEAEPNDVAVIETGLNDARLSGADPGLVLRYGQELTSMLEHFKSIPVVLVAEPDIAAAGWSIGAPFDKGTPAALAAYNKRLVEVAAKFPNASVADVRSSWSVGDIGGDMIHPSDAGHAVIASAIEAELTRRSLSRC